MDGLSESGEAFLGFGRPDPELGLNPISLLYRLKAFNSVLVTKSLQLRAFN